MHTIHIRKHLTSQTLELPELTPLVGRVVEIAVMEVSEEADDGPGRTTQFELDATYDLEPLSEAVFRSGALSRLA